MSNETIKATADQLVAHCRAGTTHQGLKDLYDPAAVSVEAVDTDGSGRETHGVAGIEASTIGGSARWSPFLEAEGFTSMAIGSPVIFEFDARPKATGKALPDEGSGSLHRQSRRQDHPRGILLRDLMPGSRPAPPPPGEAATAAASPFHPPVGRWLAGSATMTAPLPVAAASGRLHSHFATRGSDISTASGCARSAARTGSPVIEQVEFGIAPPLDQLNLALLLGPGLPHMPLGDRHEAARNASPPTA